MTRRQTLNSLRANPAVSVLIIGGGVNGIGTFRDLALQGVDTLLVERGDFGSGTSAASSHMLHGGLRYLENGEFRLVNEAPARARPIAAQRAALRPSRCARRFRFFAGFPGLLNAPLKFAGLLDRPSERGALAVKLGLSFYDFLVRSGRALPRHEFRLRAQALREYPQLNPAIVCAAAYYDAWMPCPERICLEMALDGEASKSNCHALNYVSAIAGDSDSVTLRGRIDRRDLASQAEGGCERGRTLD